MVLQASREVAMWQLAVLVMQVTRMTRTLAMRHPTAEETAKPRSFLSQYATGRVD